MIANAKFRLQPKAFWASVRTISLAVGYTDRKPKLIRVPFLEEIQNCFVTLGLNRGILVTDGQVTETAKDLLEYFEYRANVLNKHLEPRLMSRVEAAAVFKKLSEKYNSACSLPANKQTGEKKAPAYFTGIVNILIEAYSGGNPCDYDPRQLTTFTLDGIPVRTLARRVDGAFPTAINPVAIWEIKEYYYTTTFGSRVADGVYETLLDGMELEELFDSENIKVLHYLMIDHHYTWWECGRSYLCRIVDMLNMGYVHEVLVGRQVL
jgi:hypothetical protein